MKLLPEKDTFKTISHHDVHDYTTSVNK